MDEITAYRNPAVRDLAWSLQSPPLLNRKDSGVRWLETDWFETAYREFQSHLQALDRNPGPLQQLLSAHSDRRLGSYFERLWHYWLDNNRRYRLLSANLPVRNAERTLGEFDFIVLDQETGKTLHWEVAVKFYLGSGDTTQAENWWGPGRRDRLDIKTAHLLNHQSRLSTHAEARAMLAGRGLEVDASWLIMKGRLFYPLSRRAPPPEGVAAGHLHGFWLTQGSLHNLPEGSWRVLDKSNWLAPVSNKDRHALDKAGLIQWLQDNPQTRPRCIAAVDKSGETARAFVVPDDWESGIYLAL